MATRMLRRGLPRVVGGEPWPPAGEVDVDVADAATNVATAPPAAGAAPPAAGAAPPAGPPADAASAPIRDTSEQTLHHSMAPMPESVADASSDAPAAGSHATLRRGLPRTIGGEPWPPADATAGVDPLALAQPAPEPVEGSSPSSLNAPQESSSQEVSPPVAPRGSEATETKRVEGAKRVETVPAAASGTGEALRRGLPRTPGGEPWPPEGVTAVAVVETADPSTGSGIDSDSIEASEIPASTEVSTVDVSTPLPFRQTVFPGKNAFVHQQPAPEPTRYGPFTKGQWAGTVIVGGIALLGAAAMAVLFVRWFLSFDFMQDFLATYPGEYHLPEGAPVGFPGWLGWQHFFNVFLMVLIIRSGLTIRNEKRPAAFWTPRGDAKGKVSLTIWFHQSLDILWLINGVVFIVLLFVTGQWMRVIPTSWEVFPNALSAVLQYISLDWPTENGWVNYNSIQQIAYFTTIFLAAPLAAVTGFRMSGMWPKNAEKLNKAYPIEWARAVHFPVMLYFVAFIAVHVFLVFATGALRNLNHMFAVQGATDPNAYADNWTGFWFFVASLVVIAAAWVAARPLVLAPIAKLFGTVSSR